MINERVVRISCVLASKKSLILNKYISHQYDYSYCEDYQ
jgi:hypothetical protein